MSTIVERRSRTRDPLQWIDMEDVQYIDFAHSLFGTGPFG